MRTAFLVIVSAGLCACEQAQNLPVDSDANLSADNVVLGSSPTPHYQAKDGDVYVYTSFGETGPIILSYRYLGHDGDVYRLQNVADDGTGIAITECAVPCRVAKFTSALETRRIMVTDESIPGKAFADAAAGLLEMPNTGAASAEAQ
jgi:hypothetical protein